ncbi:ArnT family glycosyltransferase [Neosynechococcus sphagnicola]|uniref:ArnT family glycosyltransferase n=1 Tax=Neosynechococcus sphagnicola TaxID=1501145 RepID=UPI000ADDDDD4|nr:glycosyltransferase family 39 protein [Neosynechococcus sphagnicola]
MSRESSIGNSLKAGVFQALSSIDTRWAVGLFLAALLLYGANLGELPLRDWDEGTVAQVARDLWRSPLGSWHWLHPTLAGEPYLNKPPLMHLLIAIAYRVWGVQEWTTRLPGALLTACSVFLLYGVGRELFPQRSPAVFAALMYLTLLPVVRHGRLAMLDGAILCFSLGMMLCLLRARRDLRWAMGVGIGLGLICLTKGILGLLLGAIALGFLAWDTPRLLTCRYLWLGIGIGSLPVAFWYGAQWLHYGSMFGERAMVHQSLNRIWSTVENNSGPPWYYLWEIGKSAWPWVVFWPTAAWYAWNHRNLSWAKFTLVWSGVYLLAVSLMGTKLPWYILPVYPPLTLMGGMQLARLWRSSDWTGLPEASAPSYARGWIGIFALLSLVGWGGSVYFVWLAPQQTADLAWILAAIAFTFTITTLLLLRRDSQFILMLIWGTYLSLLLLMVSDHWVWELAEAYPVKPVAAIVQANNPPRPAHLYLLCLQPPFP